MGKLWEVTFQVYRNKGEKSSYFDTFRLEVNPDEYILDAIERIWAFHDRSLCFSHACHHSTCGACGMRVNDRESLTCITPIRNVTKHDGIIKVEPLRNFPIVSDLVVDINGLYRNMELVGHHTVISGVEEPIRNNLSQEDNEARGNYLHLADCIECGLCISACPVALTNSSYLGPAALAGAYQQRFDESHVVRDLIESEFGVWRCHSAYECTSVCPSNVDPGWKIMQLRKQAINHQFRKIFKRS